MDMQPETKSKIEMLHEYLQEVFLDEEDGYLITWTLVVDTIDKDGQRYLHGVSPDDTPSWQSEGLLHSALERDLLADED